MYNPAPEGAEAYAIREGILLILVPQVAPTVAPVAMPASLVFAELSKLARD